MIQPAPGRWLEGSLRPTEGTSPCEWKGRASHLDVLGGDRVAAGAAGTYPHPTPPAAMLLDPVAVHPGPHPAGRLSPGPGTGTVET